ncbi:hypothetical protein L596_013244 [Steinernema carpocapsae]|uniref:Uncharacterized protein n=1 Tax=Steinernema carpocapsae TaxID=34508 RepID=A0A4U5P080_STECR|nr:hypothetical protein L596_013244 [Steinernema carpocapsae]
MNPRYFKIQSVAISDNYQYPRPLIDLPDPSRERFLHVLGICLDQGNMGDLLVKVSKPASMNVLASIYKGLIGRAFFKRLTLIYAGVESQEFLEDQVNNNFRLSDVNVDSSRITEATHWPESTIPILVKAMLNPKIQVVVAKPFVLDFEIYDQVVQAWMANGTIRKCLSSDLKSIPETLPDYYIQRSSPRYGISYALLVRHPTIKDYWLTWEISTGLPLGSWNFRIFDVSVRRI